MVRNVDIEEDEQVDDEKLLIRGRIDTQLKAMNGLFIDLTPEEINSMQNIMDGDDSDDEGSVNENDGNVFDI